MLNYYVGVNVVMTQLHKTVTENKELVRLGCELKIKEGWDWCFFVILVCFALLKLCSDARVCATQRNSITRLFLLVQFRKLPGRNVYAQMHNEKEQEMTSPVNHSEDTQNIIQGEEFIDDDLDSQTLGNARGNFIFSL